MSTTERLPRGVTRHEAPYLSLSVEEMGELAERLAERGHTLENVRSLIGWLALKSAGVSDGAGPNAKARYRKMLADLDAPKSPPKTRRSAIGAAGTTAMTIMVLTVVAGASLMDRRPRRSLAQRLYITCIVGDGLVLVVIVVEMPAAIGELADDKPADIHSLCARRRANVRTPYALAEAA